MPTTIALLSVTVCITLLIRVVIPPVCFIVFIILIFIHLLFMNHKVRHLRQTTTTTKNARTFSVPLFYRIRQYY